MNLKYLSITIIVGIFFLPSVTSATSPYGNIDVYFNNNLLPGEEIAKPILKINEPFNIKTNVTVYQECKVSGKLTEIGEGYFEVISGPSKINQYSSTILKTNESHLFEWIVMPTDKWAGGSIPINFHYSIVEKGNPEPVLNSEFTVAYCTISNEYYEGEAPTSEAPTSEAPTSEEKPVTETESSVKSEPVSSSASASAFSLAGTVSVLALAFVFFRNCKL